MADSPTKDPELSSRLKKTNEELKNLQNSVKTGMINVKVLMDFRTATERARQASAAVQQWLDAQAMGGDPYKLMEQVVRQRVEMATHLIKDVTVDLESFDVDFDTPGLPALQRGRAQACRAFRKTLPPLTLQVRSLHDRCLESVILARGGRESEYFGTLPFRVFGRRIDSALMLIAVVTPRGATSSNQNRSRKSPPLWSRTMAELFLKFEDRVLQELLLSGGIVTIGRQPDNVFRIDNPAVSGHHAKIYAEGDHYVIEDVESFNGTYVNGQRISKVVLKDGDNLTIGKHTIEFRDEVRPVAASYGTLDSAVNGQPLKAPPQLDRTMVLDTAKAKEMLTKAAAAASFVGSVAVQRVSIAQSQSPAITTPPVRQTIGTLTSSKAGLTSLATF